ncbi:MAG TPA: septal ring lytic transglycosylase RlpA family protein [Stellaceae bacterium]|nr:septal ring lytic transglycosylase RlpA family protein [Stellaceae bacterium]
MALVIALLLASAPSYARTTVKHHAGEEKGIASVYSSKFVGRRTASGEVLDRTRATVAHRRLPFGTRLLVTNQRNGRQTIVTVNDRGPHLKGRVIDLSPEAAAELGVARDGLAPVEIKIAQRQ